jgi:hypothetical protein
MHIEGAVHAGIVDQAFPGCHGTRLLEVHAHHDQQVIGLCRGPDYGKVAASGSPAQILNDVPGVLGVMDGAERPAALA